MSNIPVVVPSGSSNPVKVRILTDEAGIANVQIVQLGGDDQGPQIIELLTAIRDELRAKRIQDAQVASVPYETTATLIEQIA